MPSTRRVSSRARLVLRIDSGSLRRSSPSRDQHVESVELDLTVMLARVQPVEVGGAIDPEQHRFAIDHERTGAVTQCGLDDTRVALAPIVAVAGEQLHPFAVARHDQAIAVMLDLVQPFGAVRNDCGAGRDAGLIRGVSHVGYLVGARRNANCRDSLSASNDWGLSMSDQPGFDEFQDLCYHIGLALVTWQDVEEAHFKLFFKATGASDVDVASLVYHATESFVARHTMLGRVVDVFLQKTAQADILKRRWDDGVTGLKKLLKDAGLDRNKLAHYTWENEILSQTELPDASLEIRFGGPRLQASAYNAVSRVLGYTPDKQDHSLDIKAVRNYINRFRELAERLDAWHRDLKPWPLEESILRNVGLPPKYLDLSAPTPTNKTSSSHPSSDE